MNTDKILAITAALPQENLNFISPRRSGKTTAAIKLLQQHENEDICICTNTYDQYKNYAVHLGKDRVRYFPFKGFKHRYYSYPIFKLAIIDDLVLDSRDDRFLFSRFLGELLKISQRLLVLGPRYAALDMVTLTQRQLTTITLPAPEYSQDWEIAMRENMGDQQFNAQFKNEYLEPIAKEN